MFGRKLPSSIPLLSIVQLLGLEQSLDLVWNGIVRIVTKIGRDLVGGSQQRGACPARDVQNLLVGCLLGHLYWVNGTHCEDLAYAVDQKRRGSSNDILV